MSDLRNKINDRMDALQKLMETNQHLNNPESVISQIESLSKFWSVLNEEDRDYIQGARYAIEEKMEWKV